MPKAIQHVVAQFLIIDCKIPKFINRQAEYQFSNFKVNFENNKFE